MATQDMYEIWYQKVLAEGRSQGEARGRTEGEAIGEARGRADGELLGRAGALFAVLAARGVTLSDADAARARSCRDPALLELWLRRPAVATTAATVFEPLHPAPSDGAARVSRSDADQRYERWREQALARGEAHGRVEGEARGRAQGQPLGHAEGLANALLAVLRAQGVAPSGERAAQMGASRDAALLQTWLHRAATAESLTEVLRDELPALRRGQPCWAPGTETREFLLSTRDIFDEGEHWLVVEGELRGRLSGEKQGRTQGKAEGRVNGTVQGLHTVLTARGLVLSPAQTEGVHACRDTSQLEAWLRRAAGATSTAQVFESARRKPRR